MHFSELSIIRNIWFVFIRNTKFKLE